MLAEYEPGVLTNEVLSNAGVSWSFCELDRRMLGFLLTSTNFPQGILSSADRNR